MDELRVQKAKLKKLRDAHTKAEETSKRQHDSILKLTDENKVLATELKAYEDKSGNSKTQAQKLEEEKQVSQAVGREGAKMGEIVDDGGLPVVCYLFSWGNKSAVDHNAPICLR
jgi:hypothetical protein